MKYLLEVENISKLQGSVGSGPFSNLKCQQTVINSLCAEHNISVNGEEIPLFFKTWYKNGYNGIQIQMCRNHFQSAQLI